MQREYRWLKIALVAYAIWLVVFFGVKKILWFFLIEYRMWLTILGTLVSVGIPFILIGWFIILYSRRKQIRTGIIGLEMIVFCAFSCLILFIFTVFALFNTSQETVSAEGLLSVAYGSPLSEKYKFPFQKVSFWGRKPTYAIEVIELLEKKYSCKFALDTSALHIGWPLYTTTQFPDMRLRAYTRNGVLVDDFSERYVGNIFFKVHKEHALKSELGIYAPISGIYHITLTSDWSNPTLLAQEAAKLISYTLEEMNQDTKAPCDSGILYVQVRYQKKRYDIPLPFGNSTELKNEGKTDNYYTSPEYVYETLNLWISK